MIPVESLQQDTRRPLKRSWFFIATLLIAFVAWVIALTGQTIVSIQISNTAIPSAPPSAPPGAPPGTSTSAPPGTTLPSGVTLPPGVTLRPGSTLIALPSFFPVTSTPGTLWFALIAQQVIFFQLLSALYSNTLRTHTPIISTFASIVIVLAAFGVDENIFSRAKSQKLVAAGWLILAFVDCLWVLCLTAGEGTRTRRTFDLLIGGGGLSGSAMPYHATSTLERKFVSVLGRVSETRLRRSQRKPESGNGNSDINLGTSREAFVVSLPRPSSEGTRTSKLQGGSAVPGSPGGNRKRVSNLTQSGVGSARDDEEKEGSDDDEGTMTEPEKVLERLKAMALYPYNAQPDDPNELSFKKGEILEILDKSGKWWEARRGDGTEGMVPSNYMKIV